MITLLVLACPTPASADVVFDANDIPTLFYINKSDDRNRVDYGVRLNASCQPERMEVYWREFEHGRDGRVTHGINVFEEGGYGIASFRVTERHATGSTFTFAVSALRHRTVRVVTENAGGRCVARTYMNIAGSSALLLRAHLTLRGPGSVRYVDFFGRLRDGSDVQERLER